MRTFLTFAASSALAFFLSSCGDDRASQEDLCARCTGDATCSPATASCECPAGFAGDGTLSGTGCVNIDECVMGTSTCTSGATCSDSAGSFSCSCAAGYAGDGKTTGTGCADVDECAAANPCGIGGLCVNTPGAYQCRGLYAPSAFTNHVYRLDPVSLAVLETIDPSLEAGPVSGTTSFAEDPTDRALYAVIKVSGGRHLARLDAVTKVYTDVAPLADRYASIAFDDAGRLFGVTGNGATVPETLYQLDKHTGEATLLRALGNGADGEVIQFNPEDGQLYHWSGGTSVFEAITMDMGYAITALSATFNREVFGARWDAEAHDFVVFDIASAARRFATDGTFTATDLAQFPDDLRSPGTSEAPPHRLSPATDTVAGGVTVTLVGSGFSTLSATPTVSFGAVTATGTVVDDQHLTVVAPAASVAATVDVTIADGAYRFSWPAAFTYTGGTPVNRPQ